MIAFFDGMVRAFLKSVIDHIYFINVLAAKMTHCLGT
jgi:hypothetical protein